MGGPQKGKMAKMAHAKRMGPAQKLPGQQTENEPLKVLFEKLVTVELSIQNVWEALKMANGEKWPTWVVE